ncbi:methyltransferase family protein [Shimia isoporae]|uniref:Methyltransferase family protein n=1 Tax=Shimia isoporae TaxID=647720 RepID=A0A4R1N661_9RHOB|nr:class I SAM-dependent methyltransferase [Shimia isoporae]TCL01582.1 methyltransferase family protein [Shimia isoporae]
MCPKNDPSLEAAYALNTPEDSKRLYAEWAETYDHDFAAASHYILHLQVARHFAKSGGAGPILDVGAGTGLLAEALTPLIKAEIDGTDISAEMLKRARAKGVYRHLFTGDLTRALPLANGTYRGVVSSGTFTNGHVGPEAFDELLRVTDSRGLIAVSINTKHYDNAGFAEKLDSIQAQIYDLTLQEVRIYDDGATGAHKDDTAFVALFRKG